MNSARPKKIQSFCECTNSMTIWAVLVVNPVEHLNRVVPKFMVIIRA